MPRGIYPRTAEHRAKISAGIRCRHREDPDYRTKLSAAQRRHFQDPAERAKLSAAQRRHFQDPAERVKISAALKGRPSPLKGRTWEDIFGPERAARRRTQFRARFGLHASNREARRYWKQWRAEHNLPPWLAAQHKTNGLTYFNVQVLYPWSRRWPRRGAVVLTAVYGPPEEKNHVACHINGNTRDDHPENLMWMSPFDHHRWIKFKDRARVQTIETTWRRRLEARGRRPVTLNSLLTSPDPHVENITSHAVAMPSL